MITRLFKAHPESVGETYFQHMGSAGSFGARMIFAGIACSIHGVLPFLFKSTGKETILELHRRMVTHRHRDTSRHPKSDIVDKAA